MYFDVKYKSPAGNIGTHVAVEAESIEDATEISPVMLAYGTPWQPEDFTVLHVEESQNKPIQTK